MFEIQTVFDDLRNSNQSKQTRGKEWQYVKECIDTEWVSTAGKYINLFEEKIAEFAGVKNAVACVNGTSALQVSLRLAGVLPSDEVIVPTLTFIAPVNAIAYNGANPVFMDVNEPATGVVTERPSFTNINNGLGIFASKYEKSITGKLTNGTVLELCWGGITSGFKFCSDSADQITGISNLTGGVIVGCD